MTASAGPVDGRASDMMAVRAPWRRPAALCALVLVVAPALSLLPRLGGGTDLVRVRHALSVGPDIGALPDWQPPRWPADFRREQVEPDPFFVAVVDRLALTALPDDWARATAIARHLLGSAPALGGGAIQHDLRHTYQAIVQRGEGYCGDFVRVFTALAGAAGLVVRPAAFSFDGFGGHGHIWVEVWNRERERWQLIDVFQNYWYDDGTGQPLSAAGLRTALLTEAPGLQLRALHDGVPPGWAVEAKARDYLRRGLEEWYVPWGHAVFTQDAAWPVRWFAGHSRIAEGVGTLVAGLQPPIRMLATPGNAGRRAALRGLRLHLQLALGLAATGLALGLLLVLTRRRGRAPAGGPDRVSHA